MADKGNKRGDATACSPGDLSKEQIRETTFENTKMNSVPLDFGDEQGAEVYYSFAVTPWFFVTDDLQYIDPPRDSVDRALIAGLRANIRF